MFRGSIPALITPMTDAGAVDFAAFEKLLEWHIREGSDGVVVVGTTGESATLDVSEHVAVVQSAVRTVDGRIPVIAGTGGNATTEAIELTRSAEAAGADAMLVVTPYYNRPPQEGLFRHYRAVAAATTKPLILYNVPGRTGVDLLPETTLRLARECTNIRGIKEARGEMIRIEEYLRLDLPEGFALLSGDDATACESILKGFHGDISVTANVAPRIMHEMCMAAAEGAAERARALDARVSALHVDLFCDPNPIPVKWALSRLGYCGPDLRLPLVGLDARFYERVQAALGEAGIAFSTP